MRGQATLTKDDAEKLVQAACSAMSAELARLRAELEQTRAALAAAERERDEAVGKIREHAEHVHYYGDLYSRTEIERRKIDEQREFYKDELAKAQTCADVGGVPIYESLEGREARHKSELERLNGLLKQGADKIDELKRELRDARGTIDWYKEFRTEPTGQEGALRLRAENAERACETLAAKLKAAEQERDKAQADARRTGNHGGGHVTVLPVVTLPADWMVQATADAKAVDTLKAELGAALHRATRAERKAAAANLTNEELRKVLMDIANECDEQETRPWLMIGRIFAMATKALDSKKANG